MYKQLHIILLILLICSPIFSQNKENWEGAIEGKSEQSPIANFDAIWKSLDQRTKISSLEKLQSNVFLEKSTNSSEVLGTILDRIEDQIRKLILNPNEDTKNLVQLIEDYKVQKEKSIKKENLNVSQSRTFILNGIEMVEVWFRPKAQNWWTGEVYKTVLGSYNDVNGPISVGNNWVSTISRGYANFDITTLPSNATIQTVKLKVYTNTSGGANHRLDVKRLWVDPTAYGGQYLYDYISSMTTKYATNWNAMTSTGYKEVNYNSTGVSDLQSDAGVWDWHAVALQEVGDNDSPGIFDGWNWNSGTNPEPILIVTYSVPGCSLTISPTTKSVSSSAGNFSISITASCAWTASDNVSWITVSPSSGSGNGSTTVTYEANTTTSQRTGIVTITDGSNSKSCTVTQAPPIIAPDINVTPTSITINQTGFGVRNKIQWQPPLPVKDIIDESNFGKGCIIPQKVIDYWKTHSPIIKEESNLLTSIDWSSYDSPVKNQYTCGSCWAFAATAFVENLGLQNDLSEQVVLSCVSFGSCSGGYHGDALEYYKTNGAPAESCYPYINDNGNCSDKCINPIFLEKITTVNNNLWAEPTVAMLKTELNNGPLVVYMRVPVGWSYSGGVYNYSGGSIPSTRGHSVLLVGYNDTEQSFKVKNSWGASWGEGGYFRIAYDDVTDDVMFGWYASKGSGVYTSGSNQFVIKNLGTGTLVISSITDDKNWLTTTGYPGTPFNILPSGSQNVTVNVDWALVPSPSDVATLTFNSNDPDEPSVLRQVTAIKLSQNITVITPNGGENWQKGQQYNITWSDNITENVKIELYKGGSFNSTIVSSTPSNGTYLWLIPASLTDGNDYKVKITSVNTASLNDMSDNNFTISSAQNITVITPNGGENWQKGQQYNITWSDNITENVKIELFKGGSFNSTIVSSTPSNGTYLWPIPASLTDGNDYKVKITSVNTASLNDMSDNNFTISSGCSPHFQPVWTSPYQPMNIYVKAAKLDDVDLANCDEIGIFDGSVCVGVGRLTGVINPSSPLSIIASKDDPLTQEVDGFIEGHTISYRAWKSSTSLEVSNGTAYYASGYSGVFTGLGTTVVDSIIFVTSVTQDVSIGNKWNIISFYVTPSLSINMKDIVQPLINANCLKKVQDEDGNAIENLPGIGWINNIGNWRSTEGYYLRATCSSILSVTGQKLNLPFTIPLGNKWNIISYPIDHERNALTCVQPLITANGLKKVQDEDGNAIENLPGIGWINNIVNFKPGEGYYLRALQTIDLVYPATYSSRLAGQYNPQRPVKHFIKRFEDYVLSPMNIYIILEKDEILNLSEQTEFAVFDGEQCIGSISLSDKIMFGEKYILPITVSMDDPNTHYRDGYTSHNPITFRYFNGISESSLDIEIIKLDEEESGKFEFIERGTLVVKILDKYLVNGQPVSNVNLFENFPNPFNPSTTISYYLPNPGWVKLSIYNITGEEIKALVNNDNNSGFHRVIWDGKNSTGNDVPSGMYFYRLTTKDLSITKKLLLIK